MSEKTYILNCLHKGLLFLSQHSLQRMGQYKIEIEDLENTINDFCVIEQQEGYISENPRILLYNKNRDYYVVLAVDINQCVVVTVCKTDYMVWEKSGDIIKRRA